MNKWFAVLVPCLVLGLVAAGCGSSSKKDTGSKPAPAEKPAGGSAGGGGPTVAVTMKNIQFMPKNVTVKAGGTIKWTNNDQVTHTVTKTSGPGAQFDSGNVNQGATFEQKFDTAGTIKYTCTIHPTQTGAVTVK